MNVNYHRIAELELPDNEKVVAAVSHEGYIVVVTNFGTLYRINIS